MLADSNKGKFHFIKKKRLNINVISEFDMYTDKTYTLNALKIWQLSTWGVDVTVGMKNHIAFGKCYIIQYNTKIDSVLGAAMENTISSNLFCNQYLPYNLVSK